METNIYQTPEATLENKSEVNSVEKEFYVVGKTKFCLLFIATLGLYSIYWHYQNWTLYKRTHHVVIWPIPRGVFDVFFTHSLLTKVNVRMVNNEVNYSWQPNIIATIYVLLTIVLNIVSQLSSWEIGSPYTDISALLMLPVIAVVMLRMQQAINAVMGDMNAQQNSKLTAVNYVWIVLGCILWLVLLVDLLSIFGVIVD